MTSIKLRDYQTECIDAVFAAWADGMQRPAVVLPTGAGKTVVFAHLVKAFRGSHIGERRADRVIVLVHRDELADQAITKLRATLPDDVSVGKVKAADNEVHADVMVCSVATLTYAGRRDLLLRTERDLGSVGLIVTDECHHAAAPSYRKVYDAFPHALQLGVTATLARGDRQGLGDVWEDVVYERSVLWMISKGYLSDVRTRRVLVENLAIDSVKISRGDYQAGDLGLALEESQFDDVVARAYREHAADRPGVVFTPTVSTAHAAAKSLNAAGIRTAVVDGETPREERQRIFHDYRTGAVQVLANCMVLTEGFDAPWASCAVIARPTRSAPLYTQMVGRVLRPYPGKADALVLDVVGASSNKLRTLIDLAPGSSTDVMDDESLYEAIEREQEEMEERARRANETVPARALSFAIRHKDVDMFASSDTAWGRTPAGVLFINCGDVTVFLWPARTEGLWTVCTTSKMAPAWQPHEKYRDLDLGSAMMWGEAVAEDNRSFGVSRGAKWRSKPLSERQLAVAERNGWDITGMRSGDFSDRLSVQVAARLFDRYAGRDDLRA